MLFDSPARESIVRPTLKKQGSSEGEISSTARSTERKVTFAESLLKPSNGVHVDKSYKGKQREVEIVQEELPWCDYFAPKQKVRISARPIARMIRADACI